MRLLLTLIVCTIVLPLRAQTFDELLANSEMLYDEKQYAESGKEYDKAFAIKEGTAGQYYNAACAWALAENAAQAAKYLDLAADKGWKNVKHAQRDNDLTSLHTHQNWEPILAKMQTNLDEYEKDFDKPLKEQLEKIYVRDQTLRQLYMNAEEKFGKDSDEMKYFWQLMAEQDSLNEVEVARIIEERGWAGIPLVGGQANITLWLVIQHAPLETQEKYLPLLKASVLKGESSGSHLALLEDSIQMRNGQPQTYGSQITNDKESGQQIVYEIKDPEYVNQRRKEVGLGPIQEYVKRWGIEWTVEQKEK
ncbi:DUF6624 domain-containing protein [uncultured Imperialibacter sp.]|uniref:DUF6624 domain-containing protein n=1 Tax=uncultured Imperialibacter sp. TaxID=1672639 RepID=UPI0030D95737|tara:strand:+ start:599 stop:1519 length:921 start_codon:yes stop_codon:yes gene_type:complete